MRRWWKWRQLQILSRPFTSPRIVLKLIHHKFMQPHVVAKLDIDWRLLSLFSIFLANYCMNFSNNSSLLRRNLLWSIWSVLCTVNCKLQESKQRITTKISLGENLSLLFFFKSNLRLSTIIIVATSDDHIYLFHLSELWSACDLDNILLRFNMKGLPLLNGTENYHE